MNSRPAGQLGLCSEFQDSQGYLKPGLKLHTERDLGLERWAAVLFRGPKFNSHYPRGSSQQFRDPTPFFWLL